MADELELELSYEGDDRGNDAEYGEEVDYGESEGEEPSLPAIHKDEDSDKADARGQKRPPPEDLEEKVSIYNIAFSPCFLECFR